MLRDPGTPGKSKRTAWRPAGGLVDCGGPLSEFDADGCLRPRCGDGVCPDGFSCVTLGDWGSCAASTTFCEEDGGVCQCGGTLDCNESVSICVEASVAPPAPCNTFTDEQSCLEAGCSLFVPTGDVAYDMATDDCMCQSGGGACLWWPDGVPASEDAATVYVGGDEGAVVFFETFEVPPLGWTECESPQSPLPECACADRPGLMCS